MRQSASRREWSRRVREWRRSGKTSKELAAESGVNAGTPAVVKQAGPGGITRSVSPNWLRSV